MADTLTRHVLGWLAPPWVSPARSPGPLGWADAAYPCWTMLGLGNSPGVLGISDAAAAQTQPGPAAKPVATGDGPLEVGAGQVTFDAEGNDDPKSPYFSRKITWPGNDLSGVTVGRGYDMGDRSSKEVEDDLVGSGMDADSAKSFGAGAGKKGASAKKFVDDNRDKLGEITHDVQKALFRRIYPGYVERARKNYDNWTADEKHRVAWGSLDPAILDVLVDLVYQGFTKGANPMKRGMRNDFDEFIKYIEDTPALSQYEKGRQRAAYLRVHKPPP